MVELMHVVCLFHLYVILGELVHNLCQIFVDCREDGYTDTEVRSPKERLSILSTSLAHLVAMLCHPTGRT